MGGQAMRGPERRAGRPRKMERGPVREVRRNEVRGPERRLERGNGRPVELRQANRDVEMRGPDRRVAEVVRGTRYFGNPAVFQSIRQTGLVDGCPPGLAAKNNGCLPPGQAKKLIGAVAPAALGSALLPPLYRSWYPDNDDYYYRTGDNYVYRIDRDRNYVDGYWPLYNDYTGAYYVGAAYPQDYLGYYNVPTQYQPWYADNSDYYYRYGDGSIYQVGRNDGVIDGIVSLLAGGRKAGLVWTNTPTLPAERARSARNAEQAPLRGRPSFS